MDGDGDREFYVAANDGSGSPQLIDTGPVEFYRMRFSPDGSRLVYRADPDEDGLFDLFSAELPMLPGDGPPRITHFIPHADDSYELRWWPLAEKAWIDASGDLTGWSPHAGPLTGNCWRGALPAGGRAFVRVRTQTESEP